MGQDVIVGMITFKNASQARKIITCLLEKRLIACCNLISQVESSFWWQGKIQKEKEVLAVIKTRQSQWARLVQEVCRMHSYQVPEILALPVLKGNPDYLKWVKETVEV